MTERQQIEELKDLLDRMIGNSSRLKAEILYAEGYRRQREGEWEEPPIYSEFLPYDDPNYEERYNELLLQIAYPYRCSSCKAKTSMRTKCCPNCGARMKEV